MTGCEPSYGTTGFASWPRRDELTESLWKVPFPPRTPERNATNPPQKLLEQLGLGADTVHTTVTFNGNDLPIYSFIIHFAFAIGFGVLHCVVAEYYPRITLWQGAAFGFAVWVVFHSSPRRADPRAPSRHGDGLAVRRTALGRRVDADGTSPAASD